MTAAKVLRLRHADEIIDLDDGPATIALCQRAIRASHLRHNDLATRAGVGPSTLTRLAYGDTKTPRMATVVRILMVLGWKLYASKQHG